MAISRPSLAFSLVLCFLTAAPLACGVIHFNPPFRGHEKLDRDVQATFYDTTGSAKWEHNWNWLSETQVGSWYGLTHEWTEIGGGLNDNNARITLYTLHLN